MICGFKWKYMRFVDWCPAGIKCGMSYHEDHFDINRTPCNHIIKFGILGNSTAMKEPIIKLFDITSKLYNKKAYVH